MTETGYQLPPLPYKYDALEPFIDAETMRLHHDKRATKLGLAIESGMVHINDKPVDDAAFVPFGGVKLSGNGGRYGSYVNWDEYTQTRWVTVSAKPSHVAFGH